MAPCRHRVAATADMLGTPDVPAYQEACLAARLSRLRVLGWPLALRLCTTDDGNEDAHCEVFWEYIAESERDGKRCEDEATPQRQRQNDTGTIQPARHGEDW